MFEYERDPVLFLGARRLTAVLASIGAGPRPRRRCGHGQDGASGAEALGYVECEHDHVVVAIGDSVTARPRGGDTSVGSPDLPLAAVLVTSSDGRSVLFGSTHGPLQN